MLIYGHSLQIRSAAPYGQNYSPASEYVTLAVLSIHRDWRAYLDHQGEGSWQAHRVHPASSRRIGVLGLGMLGRAVLAALGGFGFSCAGWSRSAQQIDGADCYAGAEGLPMVGLVDRARGY